MRFCMILALVLAGCTLGGGKSAQPTAPATSISGDAIVVTALDAPAVASAADPAKTAPAQPDAAKTLPAQIESAQTDPANTVEKPSEAPPARVPRPEELACLKTGGQWSVAGKAGGMSCLHMLRDAGKSCKKKSDCEGDCLARSNTCAPMKPLFGCNDILQDNGGMVTLCID